MTKFLVDESMDSNNKESHDRNYVSVNNTLTTVRNLDYLVKKCKGQKI